MEYLHSWAALSSAPCLNWVCPFLSAFGMFFIFCGTKLARLYMKASYSCILLILLLWPAWWQSNKCATLDWDQRTVEVHLNTAVFKKAIWEDLNQVTRPSILLEDVIRGRLHWGNQEKDIVRINWGRQLVPTGPESARKHSSKPPQLPVWTGQDQTGTDQPQSGLFAASC